MNGRKLAKLQAMIDETVEACSAFFKAQHKLNEWCLEEYGVSPGDVDADDILDSVFGGCGEPSSIRAKEFDDVMRECSGSRRGR
jgi:hypothetical protein